MTDKMKTIDLGNTDEKVASSGLTMRRNTANVIADPLVSSNNTGLDPSAGQMDKDLKDVKASIVADEHEGYLSGGLRAISSFIDQSAQYLTGAAKLITDPADAGGIPFANTQLHSVLEIFDTLSEFGKASLGIHTPSLLETMGYTQPDNIAESAAKKIATLWNKDVTIADIDKDNAEKQAQYEKELKERPLHIKEDGTLLGLVGEMTHKLESFNNEFVQKYADNKPNWFGAKGAYWADNKINDRIKELGGTNTNSDIFNWVANTSAGIGAAVVGGYMTGKMFAAIPNAALASKLLNRTATINKVSEGIFAGITGAMQTGSESMQIARDTYDETTDAMMRKINPDYDKQLEKYIDQYALDHMENPTGENTGIGYTKALEMAYAARKEFKEKQLAELSPENKDKIHDVALKAYDMALVNNNMNMFFEPIQSMLFLKGGVKAGIIKSKPSKFGGWKTFMQGGLPEVPEELNNTRAQDAAVKEAMGGVYTDKNFTDYLFSGRGFNDGFQGFLGGGFTGSLAARSTYNGRMKDFLIQQAIMAKQNNIGNSEESELHKFTILSNSYNETLQAAKAMEIFKAAGNEKEYKREADRMLIRQVEQALATGTTENLIKNYEKIANDPKFSEDAEDGTPGARTLAKKAVGEIKALEKLYNESDKFQNSNDVYRNRANDRILQNTLQEVIGKYVKLGGLVGVDNVDNLHAEARLELKNAIHEGTINVEGLNVEDLLADMTKTDLHKEGDAQYEKFYDYFIKSNQFANTAKLRMNKDIQAIKKEIADNNAIHEKITGKKYQQSWWKADQTRSELEQFAQEKEAKNPKYNKYLDKEYNELVATKLAKVKGRILDEHYKELALTHSDNVRNEALKRDQREAKAAEDLLKKPAEPINTVSNPTQTANDQATQTDVDNIVAVAETTVKNVQEDAGVTNDDVDDEGLSAWEQLNGTSANDPSIIDDASLSEEAKSNIVGSVSRLFETLKAENPNATFKDFVKFFASKKSLAAADKSYDLLYKGYKMAKLSGYESMNYKSIYNELFTQKDDLDFLETMPDFYKAPETVTEDNKKDTEAVVEEVDKQNGSPVGTDNTGTQFVISKSKQLNTVSSTISHASLKVEETYEQTDDVLEVTHKVLSQELTINPYASGNLKLLHPNMYHQGTALTAIVHPNFMDVPVNFYDIHGKVGQSMPFSKWIDARNTELLVEGKPLLTPKSQEYIDKIPMVYQDSDGDFVGFVPDTQRVSTVHNTEDTAAQYAESTRTIRNRVNNDTSAKVLVTFKSLGFNDILELPESKIKFLKDVDPTCVIGFAVKNGKLAWGNNKPKDIVDEAKQIVNFERISNNVGNPFEIRRCGVVEVDGKLLPQYVGYSTTSSAKLNDKAVNTVYWAINTYLNKLNKNHPLSGTFSKIIEDVTKMTGGKINMTPAPGDINQLESLLKMYVFTEGYSGVDKSLDVDQRILQTVNHIRSKNKSGIGVPYLFTEGGRVVVGIAHALGAAGDKFSSYTTSKNPDFMEKLQEHLPNLVHNASALGLNSSFKIPSINSNGIVEEGYSNYQEYLKDTQRTKWDAKETTITVNGKEQQIYVSFYQPRVEVALADAVTITVEDATQTQQTGEVKPEAVQIIAEKIVEGKPLTNEEVIIKNAAQQEVENAVEQKQTETQVDPEARIYEGKDGKMLNQAEFNAEIEEEIRRLKDMGLDDNVSNDPRELSQDELDEISQSTQIIKGLKRIHQVQVIDYIFNSVTNAVNASKSSVNLGQIKEHIKNVFINDFGNRRKSDAEQLEKFKKMFVTHPEMVRLTEAIAMYQSLVDSYDLIINNWSAFESDSLTMVKKYFNIKQGVVTNLEDASENEDEEMFVEIENEKDHDHSKTSLEISNKEGVSDEVKRLCQGIQARDANGKPMTGLFGLPVYAGFDVIFNSVSAWLAGSPANFETMKGILMQYEETHPWVKDLTEKLEVTANPDGTVKGSKAVQNQFVSAMTKHPLDMEFIMMIKDKNGNYSLNVYNTNSGAITRTLISNWKSNIKSSDTNLIISDTNGRYTYNLSAIDDILNDYEQLKGSPVGLQVSLKQNLYVTNAIKKWLFDSNSKGKGTMTEKGFFEGASGSSSRVVTITGEEKASLLKTINGNSARFKSDQEKIYTINHVKDDQFAIREYKQPVPSTDVLVTWLKNFGIRISEPTAREIITKGFRYNSEELVKWEDQFQGDTSANSVSLLGTLAATLKNIKNNIESENHLPDDKKSSIYYDEDDNKLLGQTIINALATMESKHTTHRAVQSLYDNHKSIYGFVAPTFITDRVRDLRNKDSKVIDQLLTTEFSKNSFWLDLIKDNDAFREGFLVKHLGLTAIKEMGKALYRDNGLQELSDIDHELVKLGFFQSLKQGSVTTENPRYKGLEFRMARFFSPTMSDKGTMTLLRTAAVKVTSAVLKSEPNYNALMEFAYSQLISPEMSRISHFKNNVKTTNIDAYDKGAAMFLLMPALNNMQFLTPNGEQTSLLAILGKTSDVNQIENTVVTNLEGQQGTVKEFLLNELSSHIKSEQAKKLTEWEKAGYIKREGDTVLEYKFFDNAYMNSRGDTADERTRVAAMDFTLNSMIANANSFMAIAGDPAMCFKQDGKTIEQEQATGVRDYMQTAKDTFINVGKRLASQIAPRTKMADSDNASSTYMQIFLGDSYRVSTQIKMHVRALDGKEITDAEIDKIKAMKKRARKVYVEEHYPNAADYFIIESTNAQELTTWREHLLVLEKMGKLSDEINISPEELKQAASIFSGGQQWGELTKSQQELVKKVLQPMKPVYTGQVYDPDLKIMRTMYIKTSSYPLIPQLTAGLEIDKLAKTMEKLEAKTGKTVRASYASGNKVGGIANPMEAFDTDGNFINAEHMEEDGLHSVEDLMQYSLELPRSNFGIQQNVPLKSYMKQKDEISMGTQITKLMFGNIVMSLDNFQLNGQPLSGKQLQQMYVDSYDDMVSNIRKELYHELGMNARTGYSSNTAKTTRKIEKILRTEATLRGYPRQDIEALGIDPKTGTFNLPIWLSPNSNRYEALLTAIITHRIVKIKFPGYSYVAGSQTGFKFKQGMEGIDQSGIVFTESFDGELKGNQCLAASKLRVDGELIDIKKYAIKDKETGRWMIDTDKISPEVLKDLVSFRIPSSKHSSIEPLEIVGFLPESSADLMVVSMDGTVAMGEDYDVDKRFTYHLWTTVENGKIIPIHKSKAYSAEGKRPSEVINNKIKNLEDEINKYKRVVEKSSVSQELKDLADDIEVYFMEGAADSKKLDQLIADQDLISKLEGLNPDQIKGEIDNKRNEIKKLREDRKKVIQNEIIDIQAAVLNHPEVKKISAEKLSVDEAKDDAEFLSEKERTDNTYFTPLSDMYQKSKVAIGAIGKNGTAAYSLDVVSHSLFEQAMQTDNPIQLRELVQIVGNDGRTWSEYKDLNVTFGNISTTGQLGNRRTLSAGVNTYKGRRNIGDVISERQNLMVDNEKEQIAIRVHLNQNTMMVDKVLNMLGFDKDVDATGKERSISFMFISQPIIKEYVKRLENQNSNTAEYNPNKKQDIISNLLAEYGVADESLITNMDSEMNVKNMVTQIENGGEDKMFQAAVLQKFLKLEGFGTAITSVQTSLNIDSKGIGKNLLESMEKMNAINKLSENEIVKNADKLIGDYKMGITGEKEVMELINQGYMVVERFKNEEGQRAYNLIKPTTVSGSFAVNGLVAATEIWTKYFPYKEDDIQNVFNEIIDIIGNSEMKEGKIVEMKQKIFNDMKKFLYTDTAFEVFEDDIQTERKRLFFDTVKITEDKTTKKKTKEVVKESLATFMDNLSKSTDPKIKNMFKNNKLIQRLTYEINTNGRPSLIKFDNSKAENFDEQYLYNSLIELVESKFSLGSFNGKPYDTVKLAQDLVAYSYLEGGIQEAVQFIKYIPVSYLKVFGVNKLKGFIGRNTLGVHHNSKTISNFSMQFIQHHPELITKLTEDQMKNSANYKKVTQGKLTDLNTLMSFSYSANDGTSPEPFLSIYNEKLPKGESKFQLYSLDAETGNYNRIPILGTFGMSEYVAASTGHKSIVNQTAALYQPVEKPSSAPSPVKPEKQDRFSISSNDPMVIVKSLSAMNTPMGKLAKLLLPAMSNATKFTVGSIKSNGKFERGQNTIILNQKVIDSFSDEELARVVLREVVHSITDIELMKYTKQLPISALSKGSIVKYNGNLYLYWNTNNSGKAQLIDVNTGEKFSGTPNMDKLEVVGTEKVATYNNVQYIVNSKGEIFSTATGDRVFTADDNSTKSIREGLINRAETVKNNIKEFAVYEPVVDGVTQKAPEHIKRLVSIFAEVQKELNVNSKLNELMSRNLDEGVTNEEYTTTYAGYDIFEFVERIMTTPEIQDILNKKRFKDSDKTIMDKVWEWVAGVMDEVRSKLGIDIKTENITAQSLASVFQIIQAKTQVTQTTAEESNSQAAELSMKAQEKIDEFDDSMDDYNELLGGNTDTVDDTQQAIEENNPSRSIMVNGQYQFEFNDGTEVVTGFKLNNQQETALQKMADFTQSTTKRFFTLMGYAGTGKTTIVKFLTDYLSEKSPYDNIVFSSPTHRANAVLKQSLRGQKVKTLHSIFGLSPEMDLEEFDASKAKFVQQKDTLLSKGDLLIIDESSMINNDLFDFITKASEQMGIQVIFMGDPAQIKPVGQIELGKAFQVTDNYELTKVERTGDNPLLAEVTNIRNSMNEEQMSMESKQNEKGEGVTFMNAGKDFYTKAVELFKSHDFKKNPMLLRIISGTNAMVQSSNNFIRKGIFGDAAANEYNVGDVVMGYDNFDIDYKTKEAKIINSGDYIVTHTSELLEGTHNGIPVQYYNITIQDILDPTKMPVRIKMLSKTNSTDTFSAIGKAYEDARTLAMQMPKGSPEAAKAWQRLSNFKKEYATPVDITYGLFKGNPAIKIKKTLDYGYSHTIHKSQGGTYKYIMVDSRDLSKFRDSQLRKQLKYVALSRAQTHAFVLTDNVIKEGTSNDPIINTFTQTNDAIMSMLKKGSLTIKC